MQGAELYRHLSSLAHRSDEPLSFFHVNELLQEATAFLSRFSRLREVEQEVSLGEGISPIYSEPSLVLHILYRLHGIGLG